MSENKDYKQMWEDLDKKIKQYIMSAQSAIDLDEGDTYDDYIHKMIFELIESEMEEMERE